MRSRRLSSRVTVSCWASVCAWPRRWERETDAAKCSDLARSREILFLLFRPSHEQKAPRDEGCGRHEGAGDVAVFDHNLNFYPRVLPFRSTTANLVMGPTRPSTPRKNTVAFNWWIHLTP